MPLENPHHSITAKYCVYGTGGLASSGTLFFEIALPRAQGLLVGIGNILLSLFTLYRVVEQPTSSQVSLVYSSGTFTCFPAGLSV